MDRDACIDDNDKLPFEPVGRLRMTDLDCTKSATDRGGHAA
jgi:hypothetical protein